MIVSLFHNLILGFSVALTPINLMYCFIGVFVGTFIGVLPGIGPVATIAMLLPLTFTLKSPTSALIMLAGIYYGSDYGGSTSAVLINIPGEGSSVITCLDGHQMALQGRAGPALAIAAIGSFWGGCTCTLMIAVLGPALAEVALKFGAPEYFALMFMALTCASVVGQGSVIKSMAMVVLGLLLGIIGTDVNSGMSRFTLGIDALSDGIGVPQVAVGLFGLTEIVRNLGSEYIPPSILLGKIKGLMPKWIDFRVAFGPIMRGNLVGGLMGMFPGLGGTISSFTAYMVEKKLAKDPSRFGKGAIEGVASPETANNSHAQTHFIPLLTLGIPASAVMAMMLSAMTIFGVAPGPQVMTARPDLFWGLIASMWIGNAMLLVLNLPLIGMWVKLLKIPYRILFPVIMCIMGIGVYSLNNIAIDVFIMSLVGFVGMIFVKCRCSFPPLILGIVLGPLMEENLRRALLISRGDPSVFFTRPISGGFMAATAILLLIFIVPVFRKKREAIIEVAGDD